MVRIKAYDGLGHRVGTDVSDQAFTIGVVHMDTPGGGEDLTSGTPTTVGWSTYATLRAVARVRLLYTLNGGSTWKAITTLTGNPGSYEWTVPAVNGPKTTCKVRVVLMDSSGNSLGKDDSDTTFMIRP